MTTNCLGSSEADRYPRVLSGKCPGSREADSYQVLVESLLWRCKTPVFQIRPFSSSCPNRPTTWYQLFFTCTTQPCDCISNAQSRRATETWQSICICTSVLFWWALRSIGYWAQFHNLHITWSRNYRRASYCYMQMVSAWYQKTAASNY